MSPKTQAINMNTMKYFFILLCTVFLTGACKKAEPLAKEDLYPDTPVAAPSSSALNTFYKIDPYFQLFIYRYDPATAKWTTRILAHYPTISAADNSYMGFGNPYVADSGAPVFDMVKLYTTQLGGNNIKNAKINVDQVLQFFPDYEGAKTGIVTVKKQDVILTRTPATAGTFKIGISGGGTYDENTKQFDLAVRFDETDIGGPGQTILYKFSVAAQTLN